MGVAPSERRAVDTDDDAQATLLPSQRARARRRWEQ
jgi:hypothetical protein